MHRFEAAATFLPMQVLVADDSALGRAVVIKKLRAAGVDVLECSSVASTASADARALKCALLDFELGDGLGIDVAEALRAVAPHLPIAFFTASKDDARLASYVTFDKPNEIDEAVAWVVDHASRAVEPAP